MAGAENLLCEISITDTAVLLFFCGLIGNKMDNCSRAKSRPGHHQRGIRRLSLGERFMKNAVTRNIRRAAAAGTRRVGACATATVHVAIGSAGLMQFHMRLTCVSAASSLSWG